jgi:hypothetical protein
MSNILIIILALTVYLIGVFASMVLIAYINRKGEELPEPISILSWVFIFAILVIFPVAYVMSLPFERLQDYLNNKFKEK